MFVKEASNNFGQILVPNILGMKGVAAKFVLKFWKYTQTQY